MEKWIAYAIISMIFAGFTSVVAKMGLAGITGELGLTIRLRRACTGAGNVEPHKPVVAWSVRSHYHAVMGFLL